ncbi:Ger(x)C family spore germination protein [Paenibacillus humicola]|uniref:Ger(x)C family spore germination protein n=1 Tax=Paenibacillus humicola TaxID=3110540 RepID=UPI00237C39B6|nr:Ger(x)C family spore germination protein [Paenibacillus humicola]
MSTTVEARILRLLRLLIPAAALLALTGCWNRKEINDIAIITAAGIDKKANQIELSIQVMITKGGDSGQQELGSDGSTGGMRSLVRSATGVTVPDAMARLQEQFPRRLFWSHSDAFIFSQSFAKEGLREQIDFFGRHPQMRMRSYVFVSKGSARHALEMLPPLERTSGEALRELANLGTLLNVTTKELLQMLVGDAGTAAVPIIEQLPRLHRADRMNTMPYITGTAVFKDGRMIGTLNDKLTRGLLWLKNEIRTMVITVKPKGEDGLMSFEVLRAKSELVPEIRDGIWSIKLNIKGDDDLIQNTTPLNMSNPKFVKMMEKQLNEELKRRIEATLDVLQHHYKADIMGFADAFHRKYPREWKRSKARWNEIFPEVKVEIDADLKIKRPGISTVPQGLPKEQVKMK